jgi:Tfp pilus assembly protein PilN
MPQQINLCSPILLTQKRYFSARTMAQALAVFVVLGGALCGYWVWSLHTASEGFKQVMAGHTQELASLQAAIERSKASAGQVDSGLTLALQTKRAEVLQREKLLQELYQGMFHEGFGQSARLRLVAQSIPSQVWVTEVKADDSRLEVSGFTLEPAALNDWVSKLAASSLLQGQKLATVKVERAVTAAPAAAASAAVATQRPLWSFNLVSAMAKPPIGIIGGKP